MTFRFDSLRIPVIAAPMAGGVNTPAFAAAVANAGGVGSFGFAYNSPEKIEADLVAATQLTSGPINANFFVFSAVDMPDVATQQSAIAAIRNLPYVDSGDLNVPQSPYFPNLDEQLAPIWRQRPAILTFHFGIPSVEILGKARSLGMTVGITATSLAEALAVERAGAHFVVAQGIEAGGHRGIFNPSMPDEELDVDTLVIQLVKKLSIPVVAAGGLMDGQAVRRVLNLGAAAGQLGSAFLTCAESGASPAHKAFILEKSDRPAVMTRAFSGRCARGIQNEFIDRMRDQPVLPFPIQNTLTGPLRQLAVKRNDGEYQSLWAGMRYAQARPMTAAMLMETLARELAEAS
jgi:nitronate monooxygenase